MASRYSASELVGADLVWLVQIDWAGRTYRWSSRPAETTDEDGVAVPLDGGLDDMDFEEAFSLLSGAPDERSLSLELVFPVDVAALVQAGHDLSSATGELALLRDGDALSDRMVLLSGNVTEPTYGADGEAVSLTIEQPPWEDRASFPDAVAVVSADTWPDAHPDSLGLVYPLVWGKPGYILQFGTAQEIPGSPGIIVEWDDTVDADGDGEEEGGADKLLIAGHPVYAETVTVLIGSYESVLPVLQEEDGLGRTVSTVDVSGLSDDLRSGFTDYWISWDDQGALRHGTSYLSGLGDLVVYLLQQSSVPVDYRRFAAAAPLLNRYVTAGYIDEVITPWEWIADNVLPIVPVSFASGPGGVYPIVWRLDATTADAVAHLEAGPRIDRVSPVTYVRGRNDIANEISLEYAANVRDQSYRFTHTVTADRGDSVDPAIWESHYARVSQTRYGTIAESLSTDIVYDDATADAILSWWVRARALPVREVSYEVGLEWGWLEPGDILSLTDADLSLDDQLALVGALAWGADSIVLALLLPEDVARDSRT